MAQIGFRVGTSDGGGADLGDLLVPREFFSEGSLQSCGNNGRGGLGINDVANRSTPTQITGGGTNWKQVAAGISYSSAIKTDGTLWSWGDNQYGQLGINDIAHRSTPIQTILGGTNWRQVDCAYGYHTAAIKTDGTLWSWGRNNFGNLGINNISDRSTPTQVTGGGTNWKQVSCGYGFSSAIKTDGTLWTWGNNGRGGLGTNDIVYRSTPIQTILGGTNWKQVYLGDSHTTAIKTDGTLWTWGNNFNGQLGTNDRVHRSTPVQTTAGGTNWKQVAGGAFTVTAIKTDGTLWTIGQNTYGQLGTNDLVHRSTPVQVFGGATNWKQIDGGTYFTSAIKTDGTLWGWGYNSEGQLGTNDRVHRSTPTQVTGGGTNWKQVAAGNYHMVAIKDDIS
jgi:alpha-tubulin suppressor-like RCC1 family protein